MDTPYARSGYAVGECIDGRWRVEAIFGGHGRTGMAVVYVVRDLLDGGPPLAVKTFQPQLGGNAQVRDWLRREASTWLALGSHPHIVEVRYLETIGTQVFIFMELVEADASGRLSLADHLERDDLDDERRCRWALEFALGMDHATRSGLECHRDLKPDNLLIDRGLRLKVSDFGIARADASAAHTLAMFLPAHGARGAGAPTGAGGLLGTPGYIAPEVVEGRRADVRSDIYAYGLIVHQLLTRDARVPLRASWRGDARRCETETLALRRTTPPPASGHVLDPVVRHCLAFAPEDRPQSFGEVLDALAAAAPAVAHWRAAAERDVEALRSAAGKARSTHEALIAQARSLYRLDRLADALRVIERLHARHRPDSSSLNLLGVVLTDLGRGEEALARFEEALALAPQAVVIHANKGRALRALGRIEAALECYRAAIAIDPRHGPPWQSLGNCLADLGRDEQALDAYRHALQLDANVWSSWYGLACVLQRSGRSGEAWDALEHAEAMEPGNRQLEALRAALAGEQDEQVTLRPAPPSPDATARPTPMPPDRRQALVREVVSLHGRGAFREALECLRSARQQYEPDAEQWNDEGVMCTELGDLRGALACLDRSISLRSDWVNSWSNKGRALRLLERHAEALFCYDRATDLAPHEPTPWTNKGNCLTDLGRHAQAARCYARAHALLPGDAQLARMLQSARRRAARDEQQC